MSAFTVSEEHITAMVNSTTPSYSGDGAAYRWNGKTVYFGGNRNEIAQKLWDENFRSVNYRYNENVEAPVYHGARAPRRFSPIEIVKLCHSYNYQSCETPDWEETEAYAISKAIESRAIRNVAGYDEALWSI